MDDNQIDMEFRRLFERAYQSAPMPQWDTEAALRNVYLRVGFDPETVLNRPTTPTRHTEVAPDPGITYREQSNTDGDEE